MGRGGRVLGTKDCGVHLDAENESVEGGEDVFSSLRRSDGERCLIVLRHVSNGLDLRRSGFTSSVVKGRRGKQGGMACPKKLRPM